jgi:hypothetical protein
MKRNSISKAEGSRVRGSEGFILRVENRVGRPDDQELSGAT